MSLELQRHGCVELLLKGRVAQGAAHQRGAATYSPREWLAPRRPLYRWKRLGAGYTSSAAAARWGGGCSLDSWMARIISRIGPEKLISQIGPITSYAQMLSVHPPFLGESYPLM